MARDLVSIRPGICHDCAIPGRAKWMFSDLDAHQRAANLRPLKRVVKGHYRSASGSYSFYASSDGWHITAVVGAPPGGLAMNTFGCLDEALSALALALLPSWTPPP